MMAVVGLSQELHSLSPQGRTLRYNGSTINFFPEDHRLVSALVTKRSRLLKYILQTPLVGSPSARDSKAWSLAAGLLLG